MERRLKVTWNYPDTWQTDYYRLKFQLQYFPIKTEELHKVDSSPQNISTNRLFHSINDILPRTTYLLRIRAREEFDMGQWSNWSPHVYARSWTAPEPSATSRVHFPADINSFYSITGSGNGPEDELPPVSTSLLPSTLMFHLSWVFGVCLFLILTVLAIYIFRHRKQFISKLLKLGQSSTSHTPAPPPTQLPIEEGSPLVSSESSAPPLSKEPPFLQEGEGRGEGIHLNNMGYFLVQTN
ncbi:hypothetical protein AAFF_G00363230 [Aldrovandia affinis]|uniref:Fibronectin type-III domain-containing protein n=1 Tax=Aldrovandia affinis TaxID=143900 RepID=A0AAD7VYN2_9TELE|nr:hypothetical protein AAFF_G00363230 [Aldrovandia affinis]